MAWSLTGEAELMGDGKIELNWEKKIDKLDVGKSVDSRVAVPQSRGRSIGPGARSCW